MVGVDVEVDVDDDGDVVIDPVSNMRTTELADSVDKLMGGACCVTCSIAYSLHAAIILSRCAGPGSD